MIAEAPARRAGPLEQMAASREPSSDLPEIVIDSGTHWRRWLADLVTYRAALRSLIWRNVRSRYKQAALGIGWAVLQPLLQVLVFTFVFGRLAGVPTDGVPYPLLALAGLVPWNLFQKGITEGSTSLVTNQHIITKLFFPRIYLVVASGASALIDAVVGLAILVVMMILYGYAPGPAAILALPLLAGVVLVSYGAAALLAAVNARWRDVQHAIPFLLQIGLFVTPVLYFRRTVPEGWRWIIDVNPLAGLIDGFRAAVLGLPAPGARQLALSAASAIIVAVVGFWYFTRSERTLVDMV